MARVFVIKPGVLSIIYPESRVVYSKSYQIIPPYVSIVPGLPLILLLLQDRITCSLIVVALYAGNSCFFWGI